MPYISYKLIDNFYDRVKALTNSLNSEINNEIIDYPEFAPSAENTIKCKVPQWESLDNNQLSLFETAVVYQTAIQTTYLYKKIDTKVEQTSSLKLEYFEPEIISLEDRLKKALDSILDELNGNLPGTDFIGFMVT